MLVVVPILVRVVVGPAISLTKGCFATSVTRLAPPIVILILPPECMSAYMEQETIMHQIKCVSINLYNIRDESGKKHWV